MNQTNPLGVFSKDVWSVVIDCLGPKEILDHISVLSKALYKLSRRQICKKLLGTYESELSFREMFWAVYENEYPISKILVLKVEKFKQIVTRFYEMNERIYVQFMLEDGCLLFFNSFTVAKLPIDNDMIVYRLNDKDMPSFRIDLSYFKNSSMIKFERLDNPIDSISLQIGGHLPDTIDVKGLNIACIHTLQSDLTMRYTSPTVTEPKYVPQIQEGQTILMSGLELNERQLNSLKRGLELHDSINVTLYTNDSGLLTIESDKSKKTTTLCIRSCPLKCSISLKEFQKGLDYFLFYRKRCKLIIIQHALLLDDSDFYVCIYADGITPTYNYKPLLSKEEIDQEKSGDESESDTSS